MSGFLGWLQDIPSDEVVTAAEVLIMKYPEDFWKVTFLLN